ncbi:MAG: arsenate reductase ArsC [Spirochaetales bacterium]|nr:arsenate reductase ArsC [Spirochaetales bacterium]
MKEKPKILFLCTGNSCRSQMAEGWARYLIPDIAETWSAGIEKHGLNMNAVKVMKEAGVDISSHKSKITSELPYQNFDYVITVCDHAGENCPFFPAKTKIIHHSFDDPPRLAKNAVNEEDVLKIYRRVRDEIRDYVLTLKEVISG